MLRVRRYLGDAGESAESEAHVIEAAIQQFYTDQEPPPEIHVPSAPTEQQLLEDWLAHKAERRVRIVVPQRAPEVPVRRAVGEQRGIARPAAGRRSRSSRARPFFRATIRR